MRYRGCRGNAGDNEEKKENLAGMTDGGKNNECRRPPDTPGDQAASEIKIAPVLRVEGVVAHRAKFTV
jgi:hypothetical protein